MRRALGALALPAALAVYFGALSLQAHDRRSHWRPLDPPPPAQLMEVFSFGYLRQLWAEVLFARTAVQYGGEPSTRLSDAELEAYLRYFRAITALHPQLIDAYYRCEAILAWESPRYVMAANRILERGEASLPKEVVLPFFRGFNLFKRLHDIPAAARAFRKAAETPGAPAWIGHLASVLMGEGGDIRGGLIMLQGMLATAESEKEKQRIKEEIAIYRKALKVQLAIEAYRKRNGRWPLSLQELVPDFLPRIPQLEKGYVIRYRPPRLRLERSFEGKPSGGEEA